MTTKNNKQRLQAAEEDLQYVRTLLKKDSGNLKLVQERDELKQLIKILKSKVGDDESSKIDKRSGVWVGPFS